MALNPSAPGLMSGMLYIVLKAYGSRDKILLRNFIHWIAGSSDAVISLPYPTLSGDGNNKEGGVPIG